MSKITPTEENKLELIDYYDEEDEKVVISHYTVRDEEEYYEVCIERNSVTKKIISYVCNCYPYSLVRLDCPHSTLCLKEPYPSEYRIQQ